MPLTKTKGIMPNRKQSYERTNCGSLSTGCNAPKAEVLHTYFLTGELYSRYLHCFTLTSANKFTTEGLISLPLFTHKMGSLKKKKKKTKNLLM